MKFGIREICDVVLRAKAAQKIGNKIFYKNEPVLYFDTLKTSSLEGNATTVYAQGGRGNARLVAWEGERTVTFTMEDALISTVGLSILTGAGVIEASETKPIIVHKTEQVGRAGDLFKVNKPEGSKKVTGVSITLSEIPYWKKGVDKMPVKDEDYIYVMPLDSNGDVYTEPYIPNFTNDSLVINLKDTDDLSVFEKADAVLVDYYVERKSSATQINITADKFGGNYYLEASTLWRDTNGVDMPAEFIIPNCKVQSNFNFSMSSSGDPSTFTFTMDAFPDYTRHDMTQKVFASVQVIETGKTNAEVRRCETGSLDMWDNDGVIHAHDIDVNGDVIEGATHTGRSVITEPAEFSNYDSESGEPVEKLRKK